MGVKAEKCVKCVTHNYFINKKLIELGIGENYIAHYYLVDILDILINVNPVVRSFSREIYPQVAKRYDKSPCTVERDIRNVIKTFWDKSLKDKLYEFWGRDYPPCCHELIYNCIKICISNF